MKIYHKESILITSTNLNNLLYALETTCYFNYIIYGLNWRESVILEVMSYDLIFGRIYIIYE